jgi:hypothetical protein
MVMDKPELIASLQNEARILSHLVSKVDRSRLDYRPTPGQRSTGELVRYLSMMAPTVVRYGLAETPDLGIWTSAEEAAQSRDFEQSAHEIATHADVYQSLLGDVTDATLRSEMTDFEGKPTSRGAFLVNLALSGSAAYRTQLFCYLKASGQEQLNSANLWSGVDAGPPT